MNQLRGKPTILIVDDTPQNIHFLDELLCDDYRITVATSGHDALNLAAQNSPDLILLDILMPEMDGYEVCRRLKADRLLGEIPVIFVTVKTESKAQAVGLAVGAVDYITKPFDPTIVRLRISIQLEMKRRRDAITQGKAYLNGIIASMADALIVISSEGTVQTVNQPACVLLGYSEEALLQQPITQCLVEDRPSHGNSLQTLLQAGNLSSAETTLINKAGHKIAVLISSSVMRKEDGTLLSTILVIKDITLFKQAQQALWKSEKKIRALFQNSPDIILTLDREAEVLFQNRSLPEPLAEMFPARQWSLFQRTVKALCQSDQSYTLRLAGNQETWWEGRLIPLHELGGECSVMVVLTDITEKQILQAQAVRNARLASLGVLSAGVAHEINNPNNAIHFNVSLLADAWRELMPILKEKRAEVGDIVVGGMTITEALYALPSAISGIEESSQRISRIVDNLKHMAREDSGDLEQTVIISEVIESALSILQNRIRKCTNHFGTTLAADVPPVRGNRQQLEQVFINLILNGLQALPDQDHGIRVTSALDAEAKHLLITVTDEGCGIPDENIERVTQPFFSTKTAEEGTGLGLSISLTIIKNHGGQLTLESHSGKGTVASVRLPVMTAPVTGVSA